MKLNENRSQDSGDMDQTRNSRVNPLTLTLTLNLGSWALHTILLRGTYE